MNAFRGQHYWETVFYYKDKSRPKGNNMGNCYYTGIVQDLGSNITWTESMCEGQANWCATRDFRQKRIRVAAVVAVAVDAETCVRMWGCVGGVCGCQGLRLGSA